MCPQIQTMAFNLERLVKKSFPFFSDAKFYCKNSFQFEQDSNGLAMGPSILSSFLSLCTLCPNINDGCPIWSEALSLTSFMWPFWKHWLVVIVLSTPINPINSWWSCRTSTVFLPGMHLACGLLLVLSQVSRLAALVCLPNCCLSPFSSFKF